MRRKSEKLYVKKRNKAVSSSIIVAFVEIVV